MVSWRVLTPSCVALLWRTRLCVRGERCGIGGDGVHWSSEKSVVIASSGGPLGGASLRRAASQEDESCRLSDDVTEPSEGVSMDVSRGGTGDLVAGLPGRAGKSGWQGLTGRRGEE